MTSVKKALKIAALLALGLCIAFTFKGMLLDRSSQREVLSSSVSSSSVSSSVDLEQSTTPSSALFQGDLKAQQALAQKVVSDINQGIRADVFQTGSARYDGEWAVGSYQMGVLGLGQVIWAHPELRDDYLPAMNRGVAEMLTPALNQFATEAWGDEGLDSLVSDSEDLNRGHAYLGYTNLALSMLRSHEPNNPFAEVNDALTQSLLQRLEKAPYGVVETYPGEIYPADLAAVIGSIALYDTATGQDHRQSLRALIVHFCQNFLDSESGLVFQSLDPASRLPNDSPRASGTALSAYFLSFADADVAQIIFQGIELSQQMKLLNFTGIKEYPKGQSGSGDIDSGTLISGVSPAATAFSIAGARITDDFSLYENLYQTVNAFGRSAVATPESKALIDSPLGHAILLAMLTAK